MEQAHPVDCSSGNGFRDIQGCRDSRPSGHVARQNRTPQTCRGETAPRRDEVPKVAPELQDVSETMLWSLYNRSSEAQRSDAVLIDPDSVRISEALDYDFEEHFGRPAGSLAVRAREIDRALRRWLEENPGGFVVSLGEGLETQIQRVDNGRMRWLSVDLPEAIRVREQFIRPTSRFRHFAASALDLRWMDAVDPSSGVFIVAQGLLMYLEPAAVQQLFCGIADRFPGAEMVFDAIPRWFSRMTMLGHNQTPHYRLPAMPWGIDRNEIESTLSNWLPGLGCLAFLDYRVPRGLPLAVARIVELSPILRHEIPSLVQIALSSAHRMPPADVLYLDGSNSSKLHHTT